MKRDRDNPYLSLAAYAVPVIASVVTGLYSMGAAGSIFASIGIYVPISSELAWSTTRLCGSIMGLAGFWFVWIKWWYRSETETRYFNEAMEAGMTKHHEPILIEHKVSGNTIQRVKGPWTGDQLRAAAAILVPMDGRFNLRSIHGIFGQAKAQEFRDWLIQNDYATMNQNRMVEITNNGMVMLKATMGTTHPLDDGFIPLLRDRG